MTHELCHFSLIFPTWLSWIFVVLGLPIFYAALWKAFRSNSSIKLEWSKKAISGNIYPIILLLVGSVPFFGGLAAAVAGYHPPFARRVGGVVPMLISEQDPAAKADLNNEPLGNLASKLNRAALYSVRLSPAASKTAITGTYQEAYCGADLMGRICRNNDGKLTCDIDVAAKIIRICAKSDERPCKAQSP
jgi:hypothetical protein